MIHLYRKIVPVLSVLAVLMVVSVAQADMKITLKNGKVINVPAQEDEIKSIEYVDSAGGKNDTGNPAETVLIRSAKYGNVSFELGNDLGYKQYFCDAKPELSKSCDGKGKCRIIVGSNICGDPYPGKGKYLYVEYNCGGILKRIKRDQTEIMRLSCP